MTEPTEHKPRIQISQKELRFQVQRELDRTGRACFLKDTFRYERTVKDLTRLSFTAATDRIQQCGIDLCHVGEVIEEEVRKVCKL